MYRAAVITLSDSGYAGTREDKSGPVIQELVSAAGYELAHVSLLPDDPERLKATTSLWTAPPARFTAKQSRP